MDFAICSTVLLISLSVVADARQYFRFSPSNSLVPGGGFSVIQRLW